MKLTTTICTMILGTFCCEHAAAAPAALTVTSSAFTQGGGIPQQYACATPETGFYSYDNSPPISWSKVPSKTKSIAVFLFDPDAPRGTFYHWGIFNIPKKTESLPASYSRRFGDQSDTDAGVNGYFGPCPPRGENHRYTFYVAALDTMLPKNQNGEVKTKKLYKSLRSGTLKRRVLASGTLTGTFTLQYPDPSTITNQNTCLAWGYAWSTSSGCIDLG